MKRENAKSLSEILDKVLKSQHLDKGIYQTRIIKLYPAIVGKGINSQTTNLYIKGTTLFIHLRSSVIRNELFMMKECLINKLNEAVGHKIITNIIFK